MNLKKALNSKYISTFLASYSIIYVGVHYYQTGTIAWFSLVVAAIWTYFSWQDFRKSRQVKEDAEVVKLLDSRSEFQKMSRTFCPPHNWQPDVNDLLQCAVCKARPNVN